MIIDPFVYLNGILTTIFIIISIYIGIKIMLRFFDKRDKTYLFVGLAWLFAIESWIASSTSFILAATTGSNGLMDLPHLFFLIGAGFLGFALWFWMIALSELLYKRKQKIIIFTFSFTTIIYEFIFFITLLSGDSFLIGLIIGKTKGIVDVDFSIFIIISQIFSVIIMVFTGTLFAKKLLKSNNSELKLKGIFTLLAFISFFIAAIFDVISVTHSFFLISSRLILIFSSICFYGGFILPNWMKKLFSKRLDQF